MIKKLNASDFKPLAEILEDYDGSHPSITEIFGGRIVISGTENEELDFLFRPFPKDTLTVARFILQSPGKGVGSRVLEWLKAYCQEQGLSRLVIESVLTEEMLKFCHKHGFRPIEFETFSEDGRVYGNYELILDSTHST